MTSTVLVLLVLLGALAPELFVLVLLGALGPELARRLRR